MRRVTKNTKPKKRTPLDVSYDRKDLAVAVLFKAGFERWEIAAMLRRSVGMVDYVLRKAL